MSNAVSLQTQLLLAAFAPPHHAVSAWARWQSASGWEEHLDFESYLLLPRVYHNLGGGGVDDALFNRLKGVVKRNWVANAATLAGIGRVADLLEPSGIVFVLLPPCALLLRDRTTALPADTPITCQIARRDAQCVTRTLIEAGWHCVAPGVPRWSLPGYIAATRCMRLHKEGGATLELHWVEAFASVESGTVSHALQGRTLRSLGVLASVRYLIAGSGSGSDPGPGSGAGMGSALCRLSRALLLLEKAPDIDGWRCLLTLMQQQNSPFVPVVASLSPVSAQSGTNADEHPLQRSVPPEVMCVSAQHMTLRVALRKRWQRYRTELGDDCSAGRAIVYLPGYLMGRGEMQHLHEILPRLWRTLRYYWRQRR